jgi:D-beta-D-heptose 7-phosphate kinase/D-beta-D-heptose 1-phosphate adenosyltransferase
MIPPVYRKILDWKAAAQWAESFRATGQRVVFTNGCFDVIHQGHLFSLYHARHMGDCLIVGLNSDASVKRLKGDKRPLQDQWWRAAVLACLEFVSFVVVFEEDTPEALIQAITPDVLVKGKDWEGKQIAGGDWVRQHGGIVRFIASMEGYSTSEFIKSRGIEA